MNYKEKLNILENSLNVMDVNTNALLGSESISKCPICLGQNISESNCSDCDYNFSDIFICPITNEDTLTKNKLRHCNITSQICPYEGLEYETCDIYHEYGT